MADSANILSILQSLQGQDPSTGAAPAPAAPATNVMQAAVPPQSPSPQFQDPNAQVAQAATAASPPMPKPRHSLLDTIGRISDVLAQVGGAAPLYQPTLDAAADRQIALQDHTRKVQLDDADIAEKNFELSKGQTTLANDARTRFADVLNSIDDANDAKDLPARMAAAGLTDARYAPFVKMVQDNPDSAASLALALGGGSNADDEKYGGNIIYATGPDGKLHAFQAGVGGGASSRDILPDGYTAVDPSQVVNTGGATVILGKNTGNTKRILPNSVSPNTAANNAQSNTNNIRTTTTQKEIAAMPARTAAANSKGAVEDPNIPMYLQNIRQGFAALHSMQALPGEGGALNQVEGAVGRSALGQKLGEQLGTPAAQKRLEVVKNISQLQQAMLKSLPASATRTRFEQEMLARGLPDPAKMDYNTANTVIDQLYASYQNALRQSQASQRPASAASSDGIPTLTPEQAAKLPSGARFRTTDGRTLVRH